MTPYQETLLALAAESEAAAIALWANVSVLGDGLFVGALAAIIAGYNAQAAALAEVAFAAEATVAFQKAIPVIGLAPVDDVERLTKAATTLLDTARASEVPEKIVGRLGRAEPLNTAARTYSDSIRESGLTKGWTRHMDSDPCQLCRWWWREGRIWPAEHPFQTHPGCACVPRPVWAENIQSTQYTRRLERYARAS
ncbi:hypothetical protein [Mycobacterium sp. 852002-51961_SCH5331710]|uniref:hypothetical protein n=1 Tax=Mycobacterium sp. 852002-51961_SCH5331710 TaxID=1834105 RepID=UPI0007FCCC5E|nr:hypothetical protein [Mycobacterium sp. 852002-51961_SCH5331710]OBB42698.1 hypothetical protein A5752_06185 [Mycobacterium sp. 852002-51961_SCH5331710]